MYIAKLWLSEQQYLAVLDNVLVIVTVNDKGQDVRWNIFEGGKGMTPPNVKEFAAALNKLQEGSKAL